MEWAPNPLVILQQTEAGAVLLETSTGECFELNHVGVEIWTSIAAGQAEDLIATALAKRYGITESTAASDISTLVGDLTRHGLLARPRR